MTESGGESVDGQATNATGVAALGTALVVLTALPMLAFPSPLTLGIGFPLVSSALVAVAGFLVVGGGYWLATAGVGRGSVVLAGLAVALIQTGYGLFGAAARWLVAPTVRVPALGLVAGFVGAITAATAVTVFRSERSFAGWRRYAAALLGGGFVVVAAVSLTTPSFVVLAGVAVLPGAVVDLTHGIWAVRETEYDSTVLNAVGVYAAVTGVFVHGFRLAVRLLGDGE